MGDCIFDNVPAETPLSPEEAVIRRHRKEKKDLQGKVLAMKKGAGKSDKKKKKELADEIARLENELEERHKQELDTFLPKKVPISDTIHEAEEPSVENVAEAATESSESKGNEVASTETLPVAPGTPKLSKAQKRREKKALEESERQKRVDEETKLLEENSESKKEDDELSSILKNLNLEVYEIPADGNCLYAAISHQLKQKGEKYTVQELRSKTSNYLLEHREEFVNYLEDDAARESEEGFKKYCNDIQETSAWGGQVEIKALSKILSKCILVIQANGPELIFGEGKPDVKLTFHKHKLSLGAHYNSAVLPSAS